jgi:putative component of membrane protein insertase Oxa1/YidC/SpoIIIJ protein YidD
MKLFSLNYLFISIFSLNLFAQSDWVKWDKKNPDYLIKKDFKERDYNFQSDNAGEFLIKSAANVYWFFISEVDGDNCPFHPSCSSFFIDAVKETNIAQGTLMFFDRFTRDLNVFKSGKYPRTKSGRYFDPAYIYSALEEKIRYIPPNEILIFE